MSQTSTSPLLPQKLSYRPRWNELRGIGNSLLARSTIVIPILGYMLLFNVNVVDYLKLHTDFCHGGGCEPSWRLYFFYFGCCFISLGSGVYALFCPALIKKYKDAATFFEFEKTFLSHSTSLAHLFSRIEQAKGSPAIDTLGLKALIASNSGVDVNEVNLLAGPMSEHYYLENRLNAPARVGAFIAYFIGGIFLIIPTLFTALQVAQIAYRSM